MIFPRIDRYPDGTRWVITEYGAHRYRGWRCYLHGFRVNTVRRLVWWLSRREEDAADAHRRWHRQR